MRYSARSLLVHDEPRASPLFAVCVHRTTRGDERIVLWRDSVENIINIFFFFVSGAQQHLLARETAREPQVPLHPLSVLSKVETRTRKESSSTSDLTDRCTGQDVFAEIFYRSLEKQFVRLHLRYDTVV